MSDLISRQAAINRIESHIRTGDELYPLTDTDKILNHAFEIAATCVYNLPSAQPVAKDINVPDSDCIGRQAAIDALGHVDMVTDTWSDEYALGQRDLWIKTKKALEELPSAQQSRENDAEITRYSRDAISRQDALELIDWYDHQYSEIESYLDIIREDIKSLPSAQKTGHWIYKNGAMVLPWYSSYECSECGCLSGYFKYCPECGSRNRGEEE